MKEEGTSHWLFPNTGATNSSGFTALPGGITWSNGTFVPPGAGGFWWLSTQDNAQNAWLFNINAGRADVGHNLSGKIFGCSVRCMADETTTSQLNVTPENQDVTHNAGTNTFEVTSNLDWTVSENESWLTVSPNGGNNNGTITVGYLSNFGLQPRTGQITVTADGGSPEVIVTVTQSGTPSTSFTCGQDLTDPRDGQTYPTVQIDDQCWMAKNLNIGTKINGLLNQSNNAEIEKYCYDNIELNCHIYGGLYQWNEMMDYSIFPGSIGICQTGWHIPTYEEYSTLIEHLGGASVAGGKMKETGFIHWTAPNYGATNISGFTALPAGNRNSSGSFFNIGNYGSFWSSTGDISNGFFSELDYFSEGVFSNVYNKSYGLSIRCILD
jgi:uncharacterized protein (TIGR02145 family)